MNSKMKEKTIFYVIIVIITLSMITTANIQTAPASQSFFTVRILSRSDLPTKNIANYIAQELQRISIDFQLLSYPEGAFESALLSREFDLVFTELDWPNSDVDPTVYFSKDGSGNYWGLNDDLTDYDVNEFLLSEGLAIVNESERILKYHEWQENLMVNILPIIPLYNTLTTYSTWGTLSGWDHEDGIIASLPYMEWSAEHTGQDNTSIFVDYLDFWDILNPLFVEDDFIISLVSEPLIRIDGDNNPIGILAKSWLYEEDNTELTLILRENVKWQPDSDYLYTNEYFSAKDVIFSILMYQEVSTIGTFYGWIESIEELNESAVKIYIDGDPNTAGRQSYAPAIKSLDKMILPEHYLNVSVGVNGLPDTSHGNWEKYGVNGLGTGMYRFILGKYQDEVEAIFYSNEEWWGSTPEGYNEDLDIEEYQIRFLFDQTSKQLEYESGRLSVFKDYRDTYVDYLVTPYQSQTRSEFDVTYIGFNLQSENTPEIWDPTLTEDGTMSKGLAVRKAIAHLMDKTILDGMLDIEIQICDSPLSNKFGQYVKTDITKYDYNKDKAIEYMTKAGYDPETLRGPGFSALISITSIFILSTIYGVIGKKNKEK
ncbi:MAG: hypothetical protein EAX90_02540 [Candidatus Heimdallarchaeota archaeon]|nr:hypothetical protein [Candidatus Heimdallarchaeota archaeon]